MIFLLDAASRLEEGVLCQWIERSPSETSGSGHVEVVGLPSSRRRARSAPDPRLESLLAAQGDPLLAPLRVAWLPPEREGRRAARFSDLLRLGDPRDPGRLRERWILGAAPDRCRVVVAESAPVSELRRRWRDAAGRDVAETLGLPAFVARQAALALDRAERRLRGNRYKVPRFLAEDILGRPAFQGGLATLARTLGRDEGAVKRYAARVLREIAATHSPLMIDLFTQICRSSYSRGYGAARFDRAEIEHLRVLAQQHPLVFLPTHKSNLDHAVLRFVLHEHGFPPNHTAGGINMNFFPAGPLVRRSGIFFIRRTFKDDEIYKFVLRHYIDFLIEKRFPLEWYIEGGRSRSGKLLPPRFGLLAYVVDAFRRGKSDDVLLIPVSIAYDQISDVGDYAAEQRGAPKEREGFGWLLRFLRRLEHQYGSVDLRFGEPISLRKTLGAPEAERAPHPDEIDLSVHKLAFEVCARINRVTPITPTSLALLALLSRADRAASLDEMVEDLRDLVDYVVRRRLPTTEELRLDTRGDLRRTLDPLVASGILERFEGGPEVVYAIADDRHHAAAYYRNTVIHFFVNAALVELALLRAAESEASDRSLEFWDEVMRLRDLLKFEFFFSDKQTFQAEIRQELGPRDPEWQEKHLEDAAAIRAALSRIRPLEAHRILRPFLEAYAVVAERLAHERTAPVADEGAFVRDCLAWGRQYQLQRRIRSPESVSKVLFANGVRLARNRDLFDASGVGLDQRRRGLADEIREAVRRVDAIEALASARRASRTRTGRRPAPDRRATRQEEGA